MVIVFYFLCQQHGPIFLLNWTDDESFLPVRLSGGLTDSQGLLEMYFDGHWSGVLPDAWSDNDTSVACRQLGFSGPNRTVHSDLFDVMEYRYDAILLNGSFRCTGKEQRLADCAGSNAFDSLRFVWVKVAVGVACQAGESSCTD